jgi:hypothetical protein
MIGDFVGDNVNCPTRNLNAEIMLETTNKLV